MFRFPIACQTITFGPEQRHHFDSILPAIAAAGYEGVEIGFRHLCELTPAALKDRLDSLGLRLVATHTGGNLLDPDQAARERGQLQEIAAYMHGTGTELLLYSGLRFEDAQQFGRDLEMLNRSAQACAREGVRLLYHNHHWEFADGGRIIDALLQDGAPELGLCPDLGWVYRGGADVVSFLNRARDRLVAVHLKDFSSAAADAEFTELGRGQAPLAAAADWLTANTQGMWVILEQDRTQLEPAAAVRCNADHARQLFGRPE